MKIYIVGVGGVGGYFGGVLAKAGLDVTFVARGENYKALKENGLTVKSIAGDFNVKPVQVINNISEIINPDLIIFSVKTYDTDDVARQLSGVVNKNTIILTFQNGVENDFQIKKFVEGAQVYPGLSYIITAKTSSGTIEQTGGPKKLIFGDRENSNDPRLKEIEKLMGDAGVNAVYSDDIERDMWKKFIYICSFAGITALHRINNEEILSNPEIEKQYEDCLRETISVAKAKGVTVSENAFEEAMATTNNTTPSAKSPLLLDIENGRKNEIETLNGTLVGFAKDLNIKVPVNELIYNEIKKLKV